MKYSFYDLDERIIKTRLALSGALFEMIKQKKHIKVLDVCKNACITPMTYYHHFNNKTQLLDYSIKKQLENILPIPIKLKPINIKHLVIYLIKSFNLFVQNNQKLIYSSIHECEENGFHNSYLYYLDTNISSLVKNELALLLHNNSLLVEL
ncbi:MAG: hypothetical protein MJ195_01180 [Mycoplasmoidaceae bacterium]|nr:hypothetical protein [Mycoplasmoidaceae bacterium]